MLVESAFAVLPEMIAGLGFQKVRSEANAVSCFAFSLLNALHAKNILDPIQRLQLEQTYQTQKQPFSDKSIRRTCDIFLDYGGSKIGSKQLANYGWKYRNYIEAKFLKSSTTTNGGQQTTAAGWTAEIIADLIRLIILPPEPDLLSSQPIVKTSTARYFLVLADSEPTTFLNKFFPNLNAAIGSPPKHGAIDLCLSGSRVRDNFSLRVGSGFNALHVTLDRVTFFAHYPIVTSVPNPIWMLLMRIDAATIQHEKGGIVRQMKICEDRSIQEKCTGDYDFIRNFVAKNIN